MSEIIAANPNIIDTEVAFSDSDDSLKTSRHLKRLSLANPTVIRGSIS